VIDLPRVIEPVEITPLVIDLPRVIELVEIHPG
jgi:hypothetical protein